MAQGIYKVGEVIEVTYQSAGGTSGLVDVIMEIYDETKAKDLINFPDVTMVEIAASAEYVASFTPDVAGKWRTVITSATKPGQVVKQFDVVSHNIESIGVAVAALNDISAAEVNTEVDQALADYDVATVGDITAPPMIG